MANSATSLIHAKSLARTGSPIRAMEVLEAAVKEYPDDGELLELQGIVLNSINDFDGAISSLEKATALVPLSFEGQLALAECYRRNQFVESASVIYLHLFEQRNLPTKHLSELAVGLAAMGDVQRALEVCREAVGRDPECDQALYGVAHYMGRCGYPIELILPVLENVFKLAPDVVRYRVSLAVACIVGGKSDRAKKLTAPMNKEQLSTVHCASCLSRIGALYLLAGDEERGRYCIRRSESLSRKRAEKRKETET